MSDKSWIWSCEESIPSQCGAGQSLIQQILGQLQQLAWVEQEVFGIHLALEEALTNAILHGNGLDAEKQVTVSCKIGPTQLWIEICDEGGGFQRESVPDPTEIENLDRPCGRGIMLMCSYMSSVEYNEDGNRVVMEKTRSPVSDSPSSEASSS